MEDSLIDTDDRVLERDSLSSSNNDDDNSFSRDSLLNGHHTKSCPVPVQPLSSSSHVRRRGSYTLETSPQMSISIRDQPITTQIVDSHRHSLVSHNPSYSQKTAKIDMTQSMYERPWVSSTKNNAIAKANAKQREEKLRLAKEEQEKKQKQKLVELSESEKVAMKARKRKEEESQRKLDEMKRKALERQKIVEERKERLKKAEEARRKNILRKLVNVNGKRASPQSSNNMMTMSCYGGFGGARTRPGNKEVIQNRVPSQKPLSSTGRIFGFGSSTPRPICENAVKTSGDSKKIPDAILQRCDILSRPLSSRLPDRMITSMMSSPLPCATTRPPQRQSSFKERDGSKVAVRPSSAMTASMIDFSSRTKPKILSANKSSVPKSESVVKNDNGIGNRQDDLKKMRPSLDLANSNKKDDDNIARVPSKSVPVSKRTKKTKSDLHIDSDSIDEEGSVTQRSIHSQSLVKTETKVAERQPHEQASILMEKSITDTDSRGNSGRAPPTKDLSEMEYKARLMENRRLVREKREKEREEFIKLEREKRHAEELAAREIVGMEREKKNFAEENHFTTSNDDVADGQVEYKEGSADEAGQLSQIAETPTMIVNERPVASDKNEQEKNERKKKIDSIMSRIRRPNDESSSDGGISPRRAMSPEPAELEPEIGAMTSAPAFKSSLLQSMMTRGRLAKPVATSKDMTEIAVVREPDVEAALMAPSMVLSSVRESLEDTESQQTHLTSPSSAAIRSSGIEGNSLSDANSEFAPEQLLETYEEEVQDKDSTLSNGIEREDCDGKEDSLSINDARNIRENQRNVIDSKNCVSQSSTETEEEEMVKRSFEIESLYGATNHKSVSQETCVFQN